jgi:translation initiation factor IF-3
VRRFLKGKDRVKVTIMFRGREVTHPERGTALLDKLATELADVAIVEQTPLQDGRNMTMMLAPSKSILAGDNETDKDGAAPAPSAAVSDNGHRNGAADEAAPTPTDAAV